MLQRCSGSEEKLKVSSPSDACNKALWLNMQLLVDLRKVSTMPLFKPGSTFDYSLHAPQATCMDLQQQLQAKAEDFRWLFKWPFLQRKFSFWVQ